MAYIALALFTVLRSDPQHVDHGAGSKIITQTEYEEETGKVQRSQDISIVRDKAAVKQRDPGFLSTLATGIPSPSSLLATSLTIFLNIALACMVADFVYRAPYLHNSHDLSFARVGYVSHRHAKILVREPLSSKYPVQAYYRYAGPPRHQGSEASWRHVASMDYFEEAADYTRTFDIAHLRPDTRYQYSLSNNISGFLTTAPAPGKTVSRGSDIYTFLHSSCILHNFPYSPLRDPLSLPGLRHLAATLPKLGAQFMLFLGDFIYIDVPKRHAVDVEGYRREYRQVYASPDWSSVAANAEHDLPWVHVYDDHEISNDWDRNETGVYPAAANAWSLYQSSVNPPPFRPGATYSAFVQGPASFFLIDTRRYRTPFDGTDGSWENSTSDTRKTMLGTQQRNDLLTWLAQPEEAGVRWKVIATSIPFTKNWRFGSEDTWAGYLGERQVILEAMWDVGLSGSGLGVVVLSGDRHEFAATAFPPPAEGKQVTTWTGTHRKHWPLSSTVHEFSVSPLSMFYLPIRTYRQTDNEDVCIKYLPDGNSKFGAVSISTPLASEQSVLQYRLFIDGVQAWSYTLTTPPAISGSGREKDAIWG